MFVNKHVAGTSALRYLQLRELSGLGPLTINLNIDAKTNGIIVNNIVEFIFYFQKQAINHKKIIDAF